MSIALKIGDKDSQVQGFIYLDAVTNYGKDLSGKVTSFPVDSGVNISDHFIANNPKFTIDGVISDVDVTGVSSHVTVDGDKPLNSKTRPRAVTIVEQENALQYLPSAVKQFFERRGAAVSTDAFSQSSIYAVEMLFEELLRGTYYNSADNRWRNKMTLTTLYEMEGSNFVNAKNDLIITDVSFNEDVDTGDALHVSITLEKVRFVTLEITDVGKHAQSNTKKKVASTSNKGNPSVASGKSDTEDPSKDEGDTRLKPTKDGLRAALQQRTNAASRVRTGEE